MCSDVLCNSTERSHLTLQTRVLNLRKDKQTGKEEKINSEEEEKGETDSIFN